MHARTHSLVIRYGQSLRSQSDTDSILIWTEGDHALLLLLDTNVLDEQEAGALCPVLRDWLAPLAGYCPDLIRWYHEGHKVVSDWMAQHGVEAGRRFVSAGLVQAVGPEISYVGAYSPIYLHTRDSIEQRIFDGPMWGVRASADYPGRVGSVRLRPGQCLLALSDGMLESRDREARINGDSVLYSLAAQGIGADSDVFEVVLAGYRDADAEQIDGHGLLAIQLATPSVRNRGERTLMLFKPDVYQLGLADDIVAGVAALGLETVERFRVQFSPEGIFSLWPRIYGRRWIESLQQAMPSRPLDVFVLDGPDAIARLIEFKDKLRAERAPVNSYRNLLHSPDSPAAVQREYAYLTSIRTEA